jgi:hypothetical protein
MTVLSHEPEPIPTRNGEYRLNDDTGPFCQLQNAFNTLFNVAVKSGLPDAYHINERNNVASIPLSKVEAAKILQTTLMPKTDDMYRLIHALDFSDSLYKPHETATIQLDALDDLPHHFIAIVVPSPEESIPGVTLLFEKSINGEVLQVAADSDYILRKTLLPEDVYHLNILLGIIADHRSPALPSTPA